MAEKIVSTDSVGQVVKAAGNAHAVSDSGTRQLTPGSDILQGDTLVTEKGGALEKYGVESIGEGKVLVVKDAMGNIQFISDPKLIVDFIEGQAIRAARPLTPQELDYFQSAAPISAVEEGNGDTVGANYTV